MTDLPTFDTQDIIEVSVKIIEVNAAARFPALYSRVDFKGQIKCTTREREREREKSIWQHGTRSQFR
jgi:hypothetical protein